MSVRHVGNDSARIWLPEHDAMLRKLRENGLSSEQIGVAVNLEFRTGYSRNAVIGRCHRLGLTKPTGPKGPRKMKVRQTPFREPTKKASLPIELRCAPVVPLHLSLLDLEPGQCRWPFGGDPPGTSFTFCGCPTFGESSYCQGHVRLSVRGTA